MAQLKTTPSKLSVEAFLNKIDNDEKRRDSFAILTLMRKITKEEPRMWGGSIVGFGSYRYKYESGREGEWFIAGFSPRKQSLTLYIMSGFSKYQNLLSKLGKYKTGKSCLYINNLKDINLPILQELVKQSVNLVRKKSK